MVRRGQPAPVMRAGNAGNARAHGAVRCWIGLIARANGVVKMRMPKLGGFRLPNYPRLKDGQCHAGASQRQPG